MGELVECLLEREDALHLARRPEGRTGSGVGEDVVLLLGDVGAGIHHRVRETDAAAARDAAGAVAHELNSGEGAIAPCANLESLQAAGSITGRDVLLAPIEHHPNGRACLARQVDSQQSEIADAVLGAEAASGEIADDAHAALRQLEQVGRFVAHARGELRRRVDREPIVAPVGDHGVRLHGDVRLHLRAVFRLHHNVSFCKRLCGIPARQAEHLSGAGTADVASLREARRGSAAAGGGWLLDRTREHGGRALFHRLFERGHVRQYLVRDFYQLRGSVRCALRLGGDSRHRLTEVADRGIARRWLGLRISKLGMLQQRLVEHVHCPHTRVLFSL